MQTQYKLTCPLDRKKSAGYFVTKFNKNNYFTNT